MAVRINGEALPEAAILAELRRLLQFYGDHLSKAEIGRRMPEFLAAAREQAVGARLLRDEATRLKIDVPAADVDRSFKEMVRRAGSTENLRAMAAKQGLTLPGLRASIRTGKQIDALVARITGRVPAPADEAIRGWYEAHRDDYRRPDRAQARHILLKPASAGEADKAAVHSRLLELKGQAEQGADFADLAAAHSECPSGKKTGGSLGWLARGQSLPAFDDALFALAVGGLSEPVETPLGQHLIQKTAAEEGAPLTFDEARKRVGELLLHRARGRALAEYVKRLRAEAVIEDDETLPEAQEGVDEALNEE